MSDVMAELKGQLDEMVAEPVDLQRLKLAAGLRFAAERYPLIVMEMSPANARLLAADLEELSMLRIVPPTGEDG